MSRLLQLTGTLLAGGMCAWAYDAYRTPKTVSIIQVEDRMHALHELKQNPEIEFLSEQSLMSFPSQGEIHVSQHGKVFIFRWTNKKASPFDPERDERYLDGTF